MADKKVEMYSNQYFALCGLGGVLSCGLTHWAVTPIDMVKCNKQNNPKLFNKGMFGNMGILMEKKGFLALYRGWSPTLVGYSFQGAAKFGLYELFKYKYAKVVGDENAYKYRKLLYSCASASAEFFADMFLCPWETLKLKVQTVGINDWLEGKSIGYANGMADGLPKLMKEGGMFNIIGPLWGRQIPYTVIKFVAFEAIIEAIYDYTKATWGKDKSSYSKTEQLGWTFLAGYTAGVICGAVSHPADMMASLMSKHSDMKGSVFNKIGTLYSKGYADTPATGFAGLWKGFGPRVFMIGTLTGLQWFIYDTVKVSFGIPTTGSAPPAKTAAPTTAPAAKKEEAKPAKKEEAPKKAEEPKKEAAAPAAAPKKEEPKAAAPAAEPKKEEPKAAAKH